MVTDEVGRLVDYGRSTYRPPTDLASACQHDHYSVHVAGSQVTRLNDGTVQWTSPTGHTYRVPPATYPIDTTSQQAEGEDRTGHTPAPGRAADPRPDEDQTDHGGASDDPPF